MNNTPSNPQPCINSNLRKATRAVSQLYAQTLEPTGLQRTQFSMLVVVGKMRQTSVTQLANQMGMDQTTATRSLNLLKKRGFVQSTPGEDRRVRQIALTPEGEAMVVAGTPLWAQAQAKMYDGLGQEKAEKLLALLTEVMMIAQSS